MNEFERIMMGAMMIVVFIILCLTLWVMACAVLTGELCAP